MEMQITFVMYTGRFPEGERRSVAMRDYDPQNPEHVRLLRNLLLRTWRATSKEAVLRSVYPVKPMGEILGGMSEIGSPADVEFMKLYLPVQNAVEGDA
jgi:hypothetical protein